MTLLLNIAQLGNVLAMPNRAPVIPTGVEINGVKLRELRKLRGETLEEFAQRCAISFGYLSQIERGHRPRVSPHTFAAICDVLNLDHADRVSMVTPEARRRLRAAA